MAWQSEMAATLQQHSGNGVLVSSASAASAASPTPSLDSLTGMVNGVLQNGESESAGILHHTDRISSSSASSSSGLGSSPLGNGSLFSSNATKCAICSGTFKRPKVSQKKFFLCQKSVEIHS